MEISDVSRHMLEKQTCHKNSIITLKKILTVVYFFLDMIMDYGLF